MLSGRARSILNILINEYIHTAAPVASEDIARLSPTRVSSATVRNAMSQLSEEGYISRPHISAGGIPSDRGYRCFVESLKETPELPHTVRQKIHQQFAQADPDIEVWSQRCAATLSGLTDNLAVVTVPSSPAPRLKQVQLVYIQDFLAMLIVVLQEARLLRRLLHLEEGAAAEELARTVNKLNERLNGLNHTEIEQAPLELTPLESRVRHEVATLLREAETRASLQHYVDGLRLLLQKPEFTQSSQRVGELIELLEERLLLDSVLAELPSDGNVAVHIGGENRDEALRSFSVIVCQYGIPYQASGAICVIGPTRMSYAETIGGVRYLSSIMSQLVLTLHGAAPASPPGGVAAAV